MEKKFKTAQVKDLLNQLSTDQITFSRFVEILNEVVSQKISKEERFVQLIQGIKEQEKSYWVNEKGEWMIDSRDSWKGCTWISFTKIWSIFKTEYQMEYNDIQIFIKDMILMHFKIEATIPPTYESSLDKLYV